MKKRLMMAEGLDPRVLPGGKALSKLRRKLRRTLRPHEHGDEIPLVWDQEPRGRADHVG